MMTRQLFQGILIACFPVLSGVSALGCAGSPEEPAEVEPNARGKLGVALTAVGASGAEYYLENAVFLVRDEDGTRVAALSSASEPWQRRIATEIAAGTYTVTLESGWRMARVLDGERETVTARLGDPSPRVVEVVDGEEATASFEFFTIDEEVSFGGGELGVSISVEEGAICGNGVTEPGETCDSGSLGGRPDECDATCLFVCEGACPLRVDPAAQPDGNGRTWRSPLASVQEAIDIQGALGGGEVWVRGPGPYPSLTAELETSLLRLASGVRLLGGFSGVEHDAAERPPGVRTVIPGYSTLRSPDAVPIFVGADRSWIDGFDVLEHRGAVAYYDGASEFRITNMEIRGGGFSEPGTSTVFVARSSGTLENVFVRDVSSLYGQVGFRIEDSELRLVNSGVVDVETGTGSAGLSAWDSELVLENVRFDGINGGDGLGYVGAYLERSRAVAVGSLWRRILYNPALVLTQTDFYAFDCHFERNSNDDSTVNLYLGQTWFLNSSFVGNTQDSPVVVVDGVARFVNVTFLANRTAQVEQGQDIGGPGVNVSVSNSFFDKSEAQSLAEGFGASGNCFVPDAAQPPVIRTENGFDEVFLPEEYGCADIGNDSAAEGNLIRIAAAELGVELLTEPAWWQDLSSIEDVCADTSPIDAGRHYTPLSCSP